MTKQKQFSFRFPSNYEKKLEHLVTETGMTRREIMMMLIDEKINSNTSADLELANLELKNELEFERKANKRALYEQQKQTAILNQLLYGFMPDNDFSVFGEHPFIEKWENQMRNERKKF